MAYRLFTLPVNDARSAEPELNGFLASHRVLSVDQVVGVGDGRVGKYGE